jgi:hypothetical protein
MRVMVSPLAVGGADGRMGGEQRERQRRARGGDACGDEVACVVAAEEGGAGAVVKPGGELRMAGVRERARPGPTTIMIRAKVRSATLRTNTRDCSTYRRASTRRLACLTASSFTM